MGLFDGFKKDKLFDKVVSLENHEKHEVVV